MQYHINNGDLRSHDISKAFDKVPHLTLLQQMEEINLNPYLIRWLKDCLSDRHQVVAVEGELSSKLPVVSGVPQGSILGPLLFIMYIKNVVTTISPGSEIYVCGWHYSILYYHITKWLCNVTGRCQCHLFLLEYKDLNFNEDKCRTMLTLRKRSNSSSPPPLNLNATELMLVAIGN